MDRRGLYEAVQLTVIANPIVVDRFIDQSKCLHCTAPAKTLPILQAEPLHEGTAQLKKCVAILPQLGLQDLRYPGLAVLPVVESR